MENVAFLMKLPNMKYLAGIVLWLLFSLTPQLYAQNDPATPAIYSLSVDVETGFTRIIWIASATPELTDYYLIYEGQPDFMGEVGIDISGPVSVLTNYYDINSNLPYQRSVGYTVVAVNDNGMGDTDESVWTLVHTIFLQSVFDSCLTSIDLSWNDYDAWRGSIANYNIYRYMGPGVYELLSTVPEGTNTLTLADIQPHQPYDLFVEAVHVDGRKSTSNRIEVNTDMADIPGFINADFATLGAGNHIDLSFTIDGVTGQANYNLLRSNSFDGPFDLIDSFTSSDTKVLYTDNDFTFTSSVQFYRLEVINNCGISALQSNRANNIILNGSMIDLNASLEWNEYRDWMGDVEQYRIIRTFGRENPVIDTLYGGITTYFNDDISHLADYENPSEGLVCYSVMATENTNPYGIQGKSESNRLCFSINTECKDSQCIYSQ